MSKQRLWLVEAIEREEDNVMEITVELRGGHITDETRGRWREHTMITYVSVCTDKDPGLATILVPIGARSPIATDALIVELESMIPR